jgi:hypothetical protein
MPIWADLNGDDQREIIFTVSNAEDGSRIIVFDQGGEMIASGPAVGKGYRWRHPLVVAPLGPNGELELVDVLTPHIGGVVEYYRLFGNQLEIVAQVPGFSSHSLGSRNLDQALAGDFDGDGHIELLVPNQAKTYLGAIQRTEEDAEVVFQLPIGGRLSTNIAAVSFQDGRVGVGVGHEGRNLRIWISY